MFIRTKDYFDYDQPEGTQYTSVFVYMTFRKIFEKDLYRLIQDIFDEIGSSDYIAEDMLGCDRIRIDDDDFERVGNTPDDAILDGRLEVYFHIEGTYREARPTVDNLRSLADSYNCKKFEVDEEEG